MTSPVLEQALLSREHISMRSAQSGEPDWLRARRDEAWRLYLETPFPDSNRDEKWRKDDIRALLKALDTLRPASNVARFDSLEALPEALQGILRDSDKRAGLLVIRNGAVAYAEADEILAEQGVIFTDILTAAAQHSDLLERHLYSAVSIDEGKFQALHGALIENGVFVYVPAGVTLEGSLQVIHWVDESGVLISPHTLMVVERNAAATVIEEYLSPTLDSLTFVNGSVEMLAGDNATLTYLGLQNWGTNIWHFASQRAKVGSNAVLNFTTAQLGSRYNRCETEAWLDGSGATAYLQGVTFPSGNQVISNHTLQFHRSTQTTSDLLYKGALLGRSRTIYEGSIKVAKGAQQTDAYQANRNLMLSSKAHADSIPQLEIEANDVRCTHGSTTSQLDEEEIFYLTSRGIQRDLATKLIVEGFYTSVLDRIPLREVRRRLRDAITDKMAY